MDARIVLSKVVSLAYRTRQVKIFDHDDLLRNLLTKVKIETTQVNINSSQNNSLTNLKIFCLELLENKEDLFLDTILNKLKLMLESDLHLYKIIEDSISVTRTEDEIKNIIRSNLIILNNYFKESEASDILSKASYEIKYNRSKINNLNDFISNVAASLEPLYMSNDGMVDPAIVSEIDFERKGDVSGVFASVKEANDQGVFKTGFQAFNRMFQGGLRLGEYLSVGALQHSFKTGLCLSLFMQVARLNSPFAVREGRKPLLVRMSFEDSMENNLQFMYIYIRAHSDPVFLAEVKQNPSKVKEYVASQTEQELADYIVPRMRETGFEIKMIRADPSQWGYRDVINKLHEYEAAGYDVKCLFLDYALKLSTAGCSTGPMGYDKRDLTNRLRNYCSAKNIMFCNPNQLSSEAKQLVRNGVPAHLFVNEVKGKGYYDECRTLDQVIDAELFIHKFVHNKKTYLAFGRGKHRLPTVVSEDDMYFILGFPGLNLPIMEDIYSEDSSYRSLPKEILTEGDNILKELF